MNALTTEKLDVDTTAIRDDSTPRTPTASLQLPGKPSTLAEQQEAFLRDRFSTKLEDPATGQWIRSWRANGDN